MAKSFKIIDSDLLTTLSDMARNNTRLRSHHNLHLSTDDPVQRFLNVMQPGTYVQPHRHTHPPKWELTLVLSGHAVILIFDDNATVTDRFELQAEGPLLAVEIPANTWHSVVALHVDTALLEIKPGPFTGSTVEKDFATWAPAENETGSRQLESRMAIARVGDTLARFA